MNDHNKYNSFSSRYSKYLDLTNNQIELINSKEYEFMKDYHWGKLPNDKNPEDLFIEQLSCLLTQGQLDTYKSLKQERKLKKEARKREQFLKRLDYQRKYLKDLNLTESQLLKYVEVKSNWSNLIKELMASKNKGDTYSLEQLKSQILTSHIYPIFNEIQIAKYKEILKKNEVATIERNKNQKKSEFKSRFSIELSEVQLEKILSADLQSKDENGTYYSDFEKLEMELALFTNILNSDQLELYKPDYDRQKKNIVDRLIKSNSEHHLRELNRISDYLQYYSLHVLPELSKVKARLEYILNDKQQELIEKIRDYCFSRIDERQSAFLESHKRHNQEYCPNKLKAFYVRQKLSKLFCNVSNFYGCKEAKDLMTKELQELLEMEREKLSEVFEDLKKNQIDTFEKSGGKYGAGWRINIPRRKGEEHLKNINLLLLYPSLEANLRLMD